MNQNSTRTLPKVFLILTMFSLVSSSILPYYFLNKTDIEYLCDSKNDKDSEEKKEQERKKEKKDKIRDDVNDSEYLFSKKELRYYNFKNFHCTHFQEIETPPPEFIV